MTPYLPCEVWTVDRVEEAWAVVEDCAAQVVEVPAAFLPDGIREGERVLVVRFAPPPPSAPPVVRRTRAFGRRGEPEAPGRPVPSPTHPPGASRPTEP